jgi:dGTPase
VRVVYVVRMDLAPYAVRRETSRGRLYPQAETPDRTPFQRDRDRVVHSAAFRKLQYKTQVFVTREGDFYRTRLTHSLEVAQIARSIARRLRLDEDLTEALALAHDLGHPPFGHAGENGLNAALSGFGGFDHNAQSLRVVTMLEHRYAAFDGLNLTWEMLEGLAKHNGPLLAPPDYIAAFDALYPLDLARFASAEAQVAAFADDIAYNSHDLDDGLRAGLFGFDDIAELPLVGEALAAARALDGPADRVRHEMIRRVIDRLVCDAADQSAALLAALNPADVDAVRDAGAPVIDFSESVAQASAAIKSFLFARMYRHWRVNRMTHKAELLTRELGALLLEKPDLLPDDWRKRAGAGTTVQAAEIVRDYVAGMTDRYAMQEYARLTDPAVPA